MNLNQLKYLQAIAGTGSLSAAAKMLGVSQPALSKFLTKLQDQERLELFTRESGTMKPTEAGRCYLEAADKMIMLYQDALTKISNLHKQPTNIIRLGVTPHQGAGMAAKIYPFVKKRFPETEFRFCEGYTRQLYRMVAEGEADYALTTVLPDSPGVSVLPLLQEELVIAVPVSYGDRFQATNDPRNTAAVDLAQLKDAPFILMDETTTIGQLSAQAIRDAHISPTVVFSSPNAFIVSEMIRAGMGIGLIAMHDAQPTKEVLYLKLKEPLVFRYCIIYPEEHELTREERYLTYLLLKVQETNEDISYLWNDTVLALIQEFEVENEWLPGGGW